MGHFEPVHSAHAIEQVLLSLQFNQPINTQMVDALQAAETFKDELPGSADIQGMMVSIGAAPMPMSQIPTVGRVFFKVQPNGQQEKELRIEQASVIFRTSLYSRWEKTWEEAQKYFSATVPAYAKAGSQLAGITLNIIDKFIWNGDINDATPQTTLLRPRSKYVCPHIYEANNFWHSYTGAFSRVDEKTKRLLNVNVDFLDEVHLMQKQRRVVRITTVLSDLFNQPGYAPEQFDEATLMQGIKSHFRDLHGANKDVLRNIISDGMTKRIALDTGTQ